MKIPVVFHPSGTEVIVDRGTSLLKAAYQAEIRLEADCGGKGRCGKCKVVAAKGVSAITPNEREYLTPVEIQSNFRLACQTFVRASTSVFIPPASITEAKILEDGISRSVAFLPITKKCYLKIPAKDLKQKNAVVRIVEDHLLKQHGIKAAPFEYSCLKTLSLLLKHYTEGLTAVLCQNEVLDFEAGNTTDRLYGIALDIGTTTVVGYLFDLGLGHLLGVDSDLNQQERYGSDVVTRIEHSLTVEHGLKELQNEIVETINTIIEKLCDSNKISNIDIYNLTVVGNTPMSHLLMGLSPYSLCRSPYNPITREKMHVFSESLGINIHHRGQVVFLPVISGFIGSDALAVVLATALHKSRTPKLAIDIGTNGEIVLTDGKKIVACAAAAGPAFEGAQIQCGMRGASGAIDRVDIKDNFKCHVIDEIPPRGICGSGLVDAVSCALRVGLLTDSGELIKNEEVLKSQYAKFITQGKYKQLLLSEGETQTADSQIVITQKDIRQLQLAKGAIVAGIKILMLKLGLIESDIREVYLAGGFGNYIRPKSAIEIGLLPKLKKAKITQVGNAAGSGAKMALLSTRALNDSVKIAQKIEHVDLAKEPTFYAEFTEGMAFPK